VKLQQPPQGGTLVQILDFLKDYWVLVAVGILAIFLIRIFFRALFKIASVALVIGLVLIFVFHYSPQQVLHIGNQATGVAADTFNATVKPILEQELKTATYHFNPDGTYTVQTQHLVIKGKKGDPNATVSYAGHDFTVNINDLGDLVQQHIQQGQ
jgi:hypothetical protein